MTAPRPERSQYPVGNTETWESVFDPKTIVALVKEALAAADKGEALEHVVGSLLSLIPGFSVEHANRWALGGASEVDLSVFNRQHRDGLPAFADVILVECKNRTSAMDSSEVAWFDWKLQLGGVAMGIIISNEGITGDPQRRNAAWSIITRANSATPQRRILVISTSELSALQSREDLCNLLISKVSLLAMAVPQL